jgi:hypothetical protein
MGSNVLSEATEFLLSAVEFLWPVTQEVSGKGFYFSKTVEEVPFDLPFHTVDALVRRYVG